MYVLCITVLQFWMRCTYKVIIKKIFDNTYGSINDHSATNTTQIKNNAVNTTSITMKRQQNKFYMILFEGKKRPIKTVHQDPKHIFLCFTDSVKLHYRRDLGVNVMHVIQTEMTKKYKPAQNYRCPAAQMQAGFLLMGSIPAITANSRLIDWVSLMIQVST